MRILIIEPVPEFGGGMEGLSLRLSKELQKRGHTIYLAYETAASMLPVYKSFVTGCFKMSLPGLPLRKPLNICKELRRLQRITREAKIDVVFSSHLGFIPIGAILKLLEGVPAFFHLGLPAADARWATRRSFGLVGGGISPASHTLGSWRCSGWPSESLWEVRNWVDPDEFTPAADKSAMRANLGVPSDGLILGFVGRIVPEKGVEVLIRAFNQIQRLEPSFLVMAGRGNAEYIRSLRRMCDHPDRLVIVPGVTNSRTVFGAVDVACAPSVADESAPLVVAEAMACSTPIVCSDAGSMPTILGDTFSDLVARRGDVDDLTRVILQAVSGFNSERKFALRQRAIDSFGPEEPVSQYERILSGAGR